MNKPFILIEILVVIVVINSTIDLFAIRLLLVEKIKKKEYNQRITNNE
ncbi:MAG TPA: hypothetical protein PKI00_01375 [Candidatus Pacearchaeota archaeon]|nr:hypothetical protein [Candidatus Pacearchaeota archaeon]